MCRGTGGSTVLHEWLTKRQYHTMMNVHETHLHNTQLQGQEPGVLDRTRAVRSVFMKCSGAAGLGNPAELSSLDGSSFDLASTLSRFGLPRGNVQLHRYLARVALTPCSLLPLVRSPVEIGWPSAGQVLDAFLRAP